MIWIMWVVIAILWTFVVLIIGYGGGTMRNKEEVEIYHGPPGPTGAVGAMGLSGRDGPMGPEGPPGPPVDLDHYIVGEMIFPEWTGNVNDRISRLERRAGMSV